MAAPWLVWLASPPYAALTYLCPDWLPAPVPGQRVLVPLGRGLRAGVLERPCQAPEGVALKPVLWPLEETPVLDADSLELVRDLASRHMAHPGRVLELILPRGLRSVQVRFEVDHPDFARTLAPKALAALSPERLAALRDLWAQGRMRVRLSQRRRDEELFASLAADPPWPVRPNAIHQQRLLERLFESGPMSLGAVKAVFGEPGAQALQRLARAGLVRLGEPGEGGEDGDEALPVSDDACAPNVGAGEDTPEQQAALTELLPALESPEPRLCLLHGVTGSGKTRVYLRLARRALELGRSALLLAPEVALASQLWRQVRAAFPEAEAYFSHGYQSPSRREETFSRVGAARGPVLVVGTRSALFLPLRNLGLVVLDEEHDESYKQEERLPYHAKELAFTRVRRSGGLLVLGSATPDVKTYQAAQAGQLPCVTLSRRVGCRPMPGVELVDISGLKNPDEPFAPQTLEAVRAALDAGEQVIVMLNRRGYAPVMYCMACEEVPKCPECQVGLTYHKGRERLVCHYCGHVEPYPSPCAKCGGVQFVPMGDGTERLEEYFHRTLGHEVSVLRMDRDSARRQERLDEILRRFRAGEAQVLVGTQMLSKGHHFPGVTLVVVANADMGLNLPDYRAAERTFQLLVQVSGRAGRGEKPGHVLIQTRNPQHPFWRYVLDADYAAFFAQEIAGRKRFRYPPFTRLALLHVSCPADTEHLTQALSAFARLLRDTARPLGVDVLGPAPAPLSQLKGRKRHNCLLKCAEWQPIRALYAALLRSEAVPEAFRLELDLDPVNML